MALLDNIQESRVNIQTDHIHIDDAILLPDVYSRAFILVLSREAQTKRYINNLRQRLSYLFGADNMSFSVCIDEHYSENLSLTFNFTYNPDNLIAILQFNNPHSHRQIIKLFIRLMLCFEADYIETNSLYMSDIISLYTTSSSPGTFFRDYSTRSYTVGIIWKYFYTDKLEDFKSLDHIVKYMFNKLYPEPVYKTYETYETVINREIERILKELKNEQLARRTGKEND